MQREIVVHQMGALAGPPKICIPLSGKTLPAVLAEISAAQEAEILEWRVDAFVGELPFAAVRAAAGEKALLLTYRTVQEGGEGEAHLYRETLLAILQSGVADLVDIELSQGDLFVQTCIAAAREKGIVTVVSAHFFSHTPEDAVLAALFAKMEALGADFPKIAVMPQCFSDVLRFLALVGEIAQKNAPLIAISMGKLGAITRLCGAEVGSAITFAAGSSSSAPGQLPAELVRAFLSL